MMQILRLFSLLVALAITTVLSPAHADTICKNTSTTSSRGSLTDSGGSGSDYSNNESCQFLIQPTGGGDITLSFSSFHYENRYDYIYVFDGKTMSSPVLGSFTGSNVPSDIIATSGAMLIVSTTDKIYTKPGFQGSWSTAVESSCPSKTVADNFPSVAYNLNAGSENWVTNWLEIGESDGVSSGIARVRNDNCTSGYCLRIGQPSSGSSSWSSRGAQREVDLSAATSATLTFNYYTGYAGGSMSVALEVSSDGGSNWTQLESWSITGTSFSPSARSYDISAYASANTRIRFVSSGSSATAGMYIDDIQISYDVTCSASTLLAELQMDETSWNGTANEVVDSSGNGHHGTMIANTVAASSSPAISGNPGTCGYASQKSGSIAVTGLPVSTSSGDKTTVTFWMKWGGTDSVIPIGWVNHHLGFYGGYFGFNSLSSDIYGIASSGLANGWHHVSAEFTNGSLQSNRLIIDGVEQSLSQVRGSPNDRNAVVSSELRIGGETNTTGDRFSGDIDEVRVYSGSLTTDDVQTIMKDSHACAASGPDHFLINHDSAGVHCAAEAIQVSVLDNSNQVITDYTGTITLDTQTGTGDWIATTGSGTLDNGTSDDGIATYTFVSSDNGVASFSLSYPSGAATFNIDAYSGSVRDDDTEGDITFAPSGFILTPTEITTAGTYNSTIPTQTAGNNFTVHMTAYGTTATDTTCGIIETYTGNKSIDFLGSYNNPDSGSIPLSINNSNIAMSGSASTQTINFTSGKAQLTANYKDAGSINFSTTDTTGANTISGATNNFVVKPANFAFNGVQRSSDSVANPGATTASGTVFAKAGESFAVTVSAVNSLGQVTPNYGNESSAEGITLAHALVEPSGGAAGALTGSLSKQSGGVFSGTFNWSEVGIISLTAAVADSDYLGIGNITNSLSHVGRFKPDHFEVASIMSGALDEACSAGGFNYIGQTFGYATGNQPEFQILAKNSSGTTTQNYKNDFAKLLVSHISIPKVTTDGSQKGSDNTTQMTITHQQGTASLGNVSNGVFKYTVGNDQFTYDRSSNALIGSFSSDINLAVDSISDSDSVTDNFSSGSKPVMSPTAVDLSYGRLIIDNAFGSELLDLVLPVKAQMYNGALGDFVTNTADTCTVLSLQGMAMIESLDPSTLTTSFSSLVAGEGSMTINAPGTGNTGSIGVTLNAPDWLEYDWGRPVGEANRLEPKATATFGIYQGSDSFIYRREIR